MSAEKPRVSDPIEMGSDGGRPWAEALAEAEYICLSDSREAAFQEALRIGQSEEYSLFPDERNNVTIDCRFAEVV